MSLALYFLGGFEATRDGHALELRRHKERALLAFLDLPWTDSIRNFHETAKRRTIRTPSARQVVQPLYAASVAKWRRYEAELAPIRPLLDPWAKRFGYDG